MPGGAALARQSLRFAWHLPSILGCAVALILGRYADLGELGSGERFVLRTNSISLLLCGVVVLAETKGKHPGWAPFLVSSALCWPPAGRVGRPEGAALESSGRGLWGAVRRRAPE
jgi:hypothetical protein